MRIYIIIPAHREGSRIKKAIIDYENTLCKRHKGINILIVTDTEGDTASVASTLTKGKRQFKIVVSNHREGKGGAIIHGLNIVCKACSSKDIIVFTDADDSVKGREIERLIKMLSKSNIQGLIGSRYIRGSKIIGRITGGRYIASRAYNLMVRLLFGFPFRDTQCGIKLFKAGAICSILSRLSLVDMSFDINLLYELMAKGFVIKEIPITFHQMNEGSKVKLTRQGPQMFLATLGFRISRSRISKIIPDKLKGFIYNKVKGW